MSVLVIKSVTVPNKENIFINAEYLRMVFKIGNKIWLIKIQSLIDNQIVILIRGQGLVYLGGMWIPCQFQAPDPDPNRNPHKKQGQNLAMTYQ